MGLKEVLSKMKIVELSPEEIAAAPASPGAHSSAPPRPMAPTSLTPKSPADIRDLLGGIPEPPAIDERKLAAAMPSSPGGEDDDVPDFPAIYRAAGVTDPPHGYSAYKVLEIFGSPGFAALDLRAKAAALTGFLNMNPSGPVPITDVVQDAVRRDQALDKFEEFLRNKIAARSREIEQENARLQAEIDEVTRRNREKMEGNRAAIDGEQGRLTRWLVVKRAEERKLFDAVNPFVENNPISTADSPPRPAAPTAPEGPQS